MRDISVAMSDGDARNALYLVTWQVGIPVSGTATTDGLHVSVCPSPGAFDSGSQMSATKRVTTEGRRVGTERKGDTRFPSAIGLSISVASGLERDG